MGLEIEWQGKKGYVRVEGIVIRKGRVAAGLNSAGGGGPGAKVLAYGMSVIYHIYEDASAQKLLTQGQYLGEFDPASNMPGLSVAYGELKAKVEDLRGAKDV